jgi:chromosomal replication initiation ATPase DnaA
MLDEKLIYSLFNIIDIDNKYIIVTSQGNLLQAYQFFISRFKIKNKKFYDYEIIDKPDDELLFALILKNLSDRQISIHEKLINFIIKRIDRSYGNISNFIYKIDELSLKRRKPIDFKLIREVLGD